MSSYNAQSSLESLGTVAGIILEGINVHGGITYSLHRGNLARQPFFAIGVFPDSALFSANEFSMQDICRYMVQNKAILLKPEYAIGGWNDLEKLRNVLCISELVSSMPKALDIARKHHQWFIFGLETMTQIPVPGQER